MKTAEPVTVVLGRFEDLIAGGLRELVCSDQHLSLVAADVGPDRLDAVLSEQRPTVTILNLAELHAVADVRDLHEAHPDTRLVVISDRESTVQSSQMLALGATACLSRETQARDVLNAIHLASRGLHVLPRATSVAPETLTRREAQVMALLQQGRSNAEIALELTIGVETVRSHARSIFRKLGVHSRRELAARA